MKKLLIITSVALAATCFLTVGHAKNNLQTISYDIDAATCAVTISSIDAQDLKKIVFRDSSGKKEMTWKNKDIEGSTYTFDLYMSALLADGSLHVQSHKNGRGEEIGGDLKADLESCLSTPVCPFEAEIDVVKAAQYGPVDRASSCTFYDLYGGIGVTNNEDGSFNSDGTPYVGVVYSVGDGTDTCVAIGNANSDGTSWCKGFKDGDLDSDQFRACAVYLGSEECSTFISALDGSTPQLQ